MNTYLAVANVNASMEFLERAFAFTRGVVLPDTDGQVRYAEMRHGDSVIMLVRRGDPATASGGAAALYTYVSDVDRAAAEARKAGAGVTDAKTSRGATAPQSSPIPTDIAGFSRRSRNSRRLHERRSRHDPTVAKHIGKTSPQSPNYLFVYQPVSPLPWRSD